MIISAKVLGRSVPGGSNTHVQFNDSGVFGGQAGLSFVKATNILTVSGGIVTAKVYPAADSTTAFQVNKADGITNVLNVDTTNSTVSTKGSISTATLGSELITNGTFTSDLSGWTAGANWAYSSGTALHTAGSTETLAQNISITNGSTYQIEFTISGRSAGSIGITVGAVNLVNYGETTAFSTSAAYKRTLVAGATGSLAFTITPTTDFNGALDGVTVKNVTLGSVLPVQTVLNSDGTVGIEIRSGGSNLYNTFMGIGSGRSNTTGSYNTAQGYAALYSNTTGYYNSAQGMNALYSNTTGYYNSAQGYAALYSNTTGSYNSAQGGNAGRYITGGAANQTSNNSVYLGYDTRALADGDTNEIVIGASTTGFGSNTAAYGNSSITKHIFQAGNVGIGTTNPEALLHLSTSGSGIRITDSGDSNKLRARLYHSDGNGAFLELTDDNENKTILIRSYVGGSFFNAGYVGIGTTNPEALLHLSTSGSGIRITDSGDSNTLRARLYHSDGNGAFLELTDDNENKTILIRSYGGSFFNAGNVGIGTTSPTNILSFGGNSARTFWMERHTTANTAGNTLTVQAGGATLAATNKAGGDLILQPGVSTGTGESGVQIQGCPAGGSGTSDGTIATVIQALGNKLGFFAVTPVTRQTELTDELTTITHTAPGIPDYAIQDLTNSSGYGFVTKDEGNTVLSVIANLQTRINELETKLTAYGLLVDAD